MLCITWANPASKHIFSTFWQSSLSRMSRVSPTRFLKLSSASSPHKLSISEGSMNFWSGVLWQPFLDEWFAVSGDFLLMGMLWFENSTDCLIWLTSLVSSTWLNFSFKDTSPKMSEQMFDVYKNYWKIKSISYSPNAIVSFSGTCSLDTKWNQLTPNICYGWLCLMGPWRCMWNCQQNNKFVTSVKIKATGDSKLNDSLDTYRLIISSSCYLLKVGLRTHKPFLSGASKWTAGVHGFLCKHLVQEYNKSLN